MKERAEASFVASFCAGKLRTKERLKLRSFAVELVTAGKAACMF